MEYYDINGDLKNKSSLLGDYNQSHRIKNIEDEILKLKYYIKTFISDKKDSDNDFIYNDPNNIFKKYLCLDEGVWGSNNSDIGLFTPDIPIYKEKYYHIINKKSIGSIINDYTEYNGNIYLVISESKYILKINKFGFEISSYIIPSNEGAPRYITHDDKYLYITQYGGRVSKIDDNMVLIDSFAGGDNLEGIVEKDGKLYVANAYKDDGPGGYIYNKEVIVIDAASMNKYGSIRVMDNPNKLYKIYDNIYVISYGNYSDILPSLQIIDCKNMTSKHIIEAVNICEWVNNEIFCMNSTFNSNWDITNNFFTYNINNDTINNNIFENIPKDISNNYISLIQFDKNNKHLYLNTSDYVDHGNIFDFYINPQDYFKRLTLNGYCESGLALNNIIIS